jgi:regulator of RNase E activity RraA
MLAQMVKRRVAGIVINGAIRDSAAISQQALPVYAAGVTHRGPNKDGPGEINVPIALDGMVIAPGDAVIGDADGVVCVPFESIRGVLTTVEAKLAAETRQMAAIEAGTHNPTWIDETLRRLGCEGLD